MKENHYRHLGLMAALLFVASNSVNQVYMAGLMTAPMVAIELVVMRAMYHSAKLNLLIIGGSVVAGVLLFTFIRQQTVVTDGQFLRSMIPHHSGAILMCTEAQLQDAEIRKLCEGIIAGQQQEIDQMNAIVRRLQSTRP
jgi:hypothetical protein